MNLRIPSATYRLQFNSDFGFDQARELVPYLEALGVTDVYASPLLQARQGSTHGYDVVNPAQLNPELGTDIQFRDLVASLRERGMGLLLDIVPNHMAASTQNPWWRDTLARGRASPYAGFFDIHWHRGRPELEGKVLLPILGDPYGMVLESQELVLSLDADGFWIRYHDRKLPVSPRSYRAILTECREGLARVRGPEHPAAMHLDDLLAAAHWGSAPEPETVRLLMRRLWQLYQESAPVRAQVDETLRLYNGRPGDPRSFDRLDRLLREQPYRLAFWRVATQEVGYRRFFDVSDLVAVRVEEAAAFWATHSRIIDLVREGAVTGLRIDHIDGLHDPRGYLERLLRAVAREGALTPDPAGRVPTGAGAVLAAPRHSTGGGAGDGPGQLLPPVTTARTAYREENAPRFYVVVEKILGDEEELPSDWPVAGTTGYDFLNAASGLFVDRRGADMLDQVYAQVLGTDVDYGEVVYRQKRRVMAELFGGEVRSLTADLGVLAAADRYGHDLTLAELQEALVEVTAALPVYRTYTRSLAVAERDRRYLEVALAQARGRAADRGPVPDLGPALDFLGRVLLLEGTDALPPAQGEAWLRFVMRWQQFTGPVTAKGVEDTALYRYNRLISLNTVGGEPDAQGVPVAGFHRWNQARLERHPHALNATSTHDSKRSEDVRARIHVLSEIPAAWEQRLTRWREWNAGLKRQVEGRPVPDANMEVLIYQTLLGAWPLHQEEVPEFRERIRGYLVKAAREAKAHTSWLHPSAEYEEALTAFADRLLEPGPENRFLPDFLAFQRPIAYYGALSSLAQVLLKVTAPGVPDIYRGTELWDFSLVDPDNRRPVDFARRSRWLAEMAPVQEAAAGALAEMAAGLLAEWEDGRVKLYLTARALGFRRQHPDLYAFGAYVPLATTGPGHDHLLAFARRLGERWAVTVVPRLLVRLLRTVGGEGPGGADASGEKELPIRPPLGEAVWGDTAVVLPRSAPTHWQNVLTGERLEGVGGGFLRVGSLLRRFPVALLLGEPGADPIVGR